MSWDSATNIILISAIALLAVLGCLGIYQWLSRKSFRKIDPELRWALVPIGLMLVVYYLFNHVFIWNTRPNGSGEPSFPSSHTMLVVTVFALAALVLPKYIKQRSLRIAIDVVMLILAILVCIGRVLANMHWVSDIVGAVIFSSIFVLVYYLIIRRYHNA